MIAIATVITDFDLEVVHWTNLDGQASDRAAQGDRRLAGVIAMPWTATLRCAGKDAGEDGPAGHRATSAHDWCLSSAASRARLDDIASRPAGYMSRQ
ncbi:hypothetical protein JX266_011867 [Neoarthrinium moseri]|nr:hypothetical protein JX266_011867 [Neoarthrinium moseri]